jgi:DNA modification methylase
MILGDFREVAPALPDNSIHLIYTDPPYKRALARPCFELLAEHAPRLLKDGGSLVTIVPHYFLEEAIDILRGALKFRWIYDMDQEEGPHPRMAMGIEVCWKPMLHYVKRAFPSGRGFLRDKIKIPGPEKFLHEWQQAEAWAEYYIEKLTEPGDLVLDPFCGPGTVPAVCIRKGRRFIGVEKDEAVCQQAKLRIERAYATHDHRPRPVHSP